MNPPAPQPAPKPTDPHVPLVIQVWQNVFGQIILVMSHFLVIQETDLKSGPFNEKYICHSCSHVSREVTFSFFDKRKFFAAEIYLHIKIISTNKAPLLFVFNFVQYLYQKRLCFSQTNLCRNLFGRKRINFLFTIY